MSNFLRQLQIISSIKSRSESDKFKKPLYKVIAPVLATHPAVQTLHTQVFNKNFVLKSQDGYSEHNQKQPKSKRNLTIILPWIMAKEKHIDKYRDMYLQKGFDVLTVSISPQQVLFPKSGIQVVAKNILEYVKVHSEYDKVLIHLFSVGAYLMGEVFTILQESGDKYESFPEKVAGIILDSAADVAGLTTGVARAVSKNPLTIRVLEWYINMHLSLFYNVATKYYYRASKNFFDCPLKCPALLFVSRADVIGTLARNQSLADSWASKGVDVTMKCWENSHHVNHMHLYKDEYISEVYKLLGKLEIEFNEKAIKNEYK